MEIGKYACDAVIHMYVKASARQKGRPIGVEWNNTFRKRT